MARYIDVDKEIPKIKNLPQCGGEVMLRSVCDVLYNAPTADVVEVVRCSKCMHGRSIDKSKLPEKYYREDCIVCTCEDVVGDESMIYLPTHFCSYGERRTDSEEM